MTGFLKFCWKKWFQLTFSRGKILGKHCQYSSVHHTKIHMTSALTL